MRLLISICLCFPAWMVSAQDNPGNALSSTADAEVTAPAEPLPLEESAAAAATPAPEAIPGLAESLARVRQLQEMRDASWPVAPAPVSLQPERAQPVLYGMALSQDPLIRERAAEAWAALDTPEALEMLLNFLCDYDPETRAIAARRLSGWAPGPLFEAVARVLDGKDAMRAAGVDLALPELRPALETDMLALFANGEEPPQRRAAAAYCLGRMGSPQAVPKLAEGARSQDTPFALACAQALHLLHATDQVSLWSELTGHTDMYMRAIALDALAETGGPDALEALRRVATGETGERSIHLLQQAARGIALFPFDDAVPTLIEVMSKNLKLRMFVYNLLELRTGVDAGQTPSEWQKWYDALKANGGVPLEPVEGDTGQNAAAPPQAPMTGQEGNAPEQQHIPGQGIPAPDTDRPMLQGFSVVQ